MDTPIAHWATRFAFAAAIYAVTTMIWIATERGWGMLGLFVASVVFAVVGALAWGAAASVGARFIADHRYRLAAHPVLVVGLFLVLSFFGLALLDDDPSGGIGRDIGWFAALMAVCAALDAALGFLLLRRAAARATRQPL